MSEDLNTENLSQKESYDLKRQTKEREVKHFQQKKLIKRALLWVVVFTALGGTIFGLVKLASTLPPKEQGALLSNAVSSSDWSNGNKDAKAVLVEYGDFQCPACGAVHPLVKQLENDYKGKMLFVFRHFPLRQIHANADLASRAAQSAGLQGKFWEMYDMIFENQNVWSAQPKATDTFVGYAQKIGLDIERFKKDLDSEEVKKEIDNDYQSGIQSGVNGTPTFFLNGKKIQPTSYEDFKSLLDKAVGSGS